MIHTTLGRYFFKRYIITTFWFFVGIMSIILLVDFSETTSRMSSLAGYSLPGALFMTAVRLPLILQQTIPFITLFVGMTVLIALNRRYELVVTRAAGVSVWQFMGPFVTGALLVGLFVLTVLNPLAAWGQRAALDLETNWREAAGVTRRSQTVPWLRQISGNEDTIIGAKAIVDDGTMLVDVVLIHFSGDGRVILRQDAQTAKLEDGYWLLKGVTESRPGEVSTKLDTARVRTNLKQEFVQQRLSQPETVAFFELSEKIAIAKSFGVSTKALETQFHSLLSLPFLLVAMTLIAATVTLKFSRFAQSSSVILGGIISGFMLYVVTVLVKAFGSSGVVPPFIAAWIPVVVAMAIGATVLLHQEDG
ncbi:LPS export ABC transporter permease LptG [Rhizobiaceae bacterium n13]|uniref:LPS export ABC transporter permease LptG n=1 Tax=Ferirhizobium litorale TaxID=2927786 RepID=UPI0024B2CEF8|nr:LPS export ABC transporter permease LptG [Fererhizobium litorale]MDI7861080.1 LPS export ABC transporter permease LptG [Fererhizobium litorale]